MAAGDEHIAGPDGWPLCGSNSPLRGYTATSPRCGDCAAMERQSSWTVPTPTAPALPPRAMLRPTRLTVRR